MTDLVKILCSTVLLLRKYEKIATKVKSIWNYMATMRDPHQKPIEPMAIQIVKIYFILQFNILLYVIFSSNKKGRRTFLRNLLILHHDMYSKKKTKNIF